MYTVEIKFNIINNTKNDEQEESICSLFDTWRMNGQILNNEHIYAQQENAYIMFVLTPEKDSLTSKYNNQYAQKRINDLESISLEKPIFTVLDNKPQEDELCDCKKISSYILYTTYISLAPALRCKKCFGTIPLYNIPKIYDDSDYHPLITWQSDYQSCDSLQMNCSVGEKFAMKQLSSIESQLTKDGLDICNKIQEVTGTQTYYYLYKYYAKSKKQELLRKCPKCHGAWLRKNALHDKFDFECKKCGLLSNIGWNVR